MAQSARCYVQRYDDLSDVSAAETHWNSQGRSDDRLYGCSDPRKVKFLADGGCQDEPPTEQCINNPDCHGVAQKSGGCWHLTRFSTNTTGHTVPGERYRRWLPVRDPGSVQLEVTFVTPNFIGIGQDAVKQWLYKIPEAATGEISTTQNIDKVSTQTSFGVKSMPLTPRNYTLSLGYETVGGIVSYPGAWQKPFTVEGGSVMSPEIIKLNFLGTGSPVPTGTTGGYMKGYYIINSLTDDLTSKTYGDAATCKVLAETQAAKDRNVYAWGHRSASFDVEGNRNTCFFYRTHPDYPGTYDAPSGKGQTTTRVSRCVDPAKSIYLGCRETYLGAFTDVPVETQFALGSYIYNQSKTWALQFINHMGRFMLISIDTSNGTSKIILDYDQVSVGADASIILRQGVELLQGANQDAAQRDPVGADEPPSSFVGYEFEYDNEGSFHVYKRMAGLLEGPPTLLASYP